MQMINLDMIPGRIAPVVHVSQGDIGREIEFTLYENGTEYTIPESASVTVQGTKSDSHAFIYSNSEGTEVAFDGAVVTLLTTEQMTIIAGKVICEIKVKTADATLYTANFIIDVESSALPSDAELSASDLPLIKKAEEAADKLADISDEIEKADELVAQIKDNVTTAKNSATSAAASATAAATSASNAKTSETNAASSKSAAATSASNASTYASNAKTSASSASSSASAAATSASNAKTSETNAASSAEAAAKSAAEASSAITGVATWNSRSGAVKPQSGDYTADMVGALSKDSVTSTYSATGTAPVNGTAVASAISGKSDLASTVKNISISGTTITVTFGDGSTSTLTTQDTNTTYSAATTSAAGLMSASDKTKLNGIATGATKVTVDSALSSTSTNPVRNSVIYSALSNKANTTDLETVTTEVTARPSTRRLATQTLTASGGTLTWTDDSISDDALIDVYASIPNIAPSAITQSGTTCTVTFDAQDSAFDVAIVVM